MLQRTACELFFSSQFEDMLPSHAAQLQAAVEPAQGTTRHSALLNQPLDDVEAARVQYRLEEEEAQYEEFIRKDALSAKNTTSGSRRVLEAESKGDSSQGEENAEADNDDNDDDDMTFFHPALVVPDDSGFVQNDPEVMGNHSCANSFALLLALPDKEARSVFFKVLLCLRLPKFDRYSLLHPSVALQTSMLTERWRRREISNFDYLWHLNRLAGRTILDLNQYPVFPWVIAYNPFPVQSGKQKTTLSLPELVSVILGPALHPLAPLIFRDLRLPIGRLDPERWDVIRDRFECFTEVDTGIPAFHYGSHYSNAATTCYYLLRNQPFAALHVELQSGRFDVPDRLFASIPSAWRSCLTSLSCFKELTPEFFYDPSFLRNSAKYPLGQTQEGLQVDDVELPDWANGSPETYVAVNRLALESEYVSANLHHWIDLIFGYKQRGEAARKAGNLFCHLTYEGAVDVTTIQDPLSREAALIQIQQFGQTPSQLFLSPHPPRIPLAPMGSTLSTFKDVPCALIPEFERLLAIAPMARTRAEALAPESYETWNQAPPSPSEMVDDSSVAAQSRSTQTDVSAADHVGTSRAATQEAPSVQPKFSTHLTVNPAQEPKLARVQELKSVVAAARARADSALRRRVREQPQGPSLGDYASTPGSSAHQRSQSLFLNKNYVFEPWSEDGNVDSEVMSLGLEGNGEKAQAGPEEESKDTTLDSQAAAAGGETDGDASEKAAAELDLLTALETLEAMAADPILNSWTSSSLSIGAGLQSPSKELPTLTEDSPSAANPSQGQLSTTSMNETQASERPAMLSAEAQSRRVRPPHSAWIPLAAWNPAATRRTEHRPQCKRTKYMRRNLVLTNGDIICGIRHARLATTNKTFQRVHLLPSDVYSLLKQKGQTRKTVPSSGYGVVSPLRSTGSSTKRVQALLDAIEQEDEDHEPESEQEESQLLKAIDEEDNQLDADESEQPSPVPAVEDVIEDAHQSDEEDLLDVEEIVRRQAARAERQRELTRKIAAAQERSRRIKVRRERRRLWSLLRLLRRSGLTSARNHAHLLVFFKGLQTRELPADSCPHFRLLDEVQVTPGYPQNGLTIGWTNPNVLAVLPWVRDEDVVLNQTTGQDASADGLDSDEALDSHPKEENHHACQFAPDSQPCTFLTVSSSVTLDQDKDQQYPIFSVTFAERPSQVSVHETAVGQASSLVYQLCTTFIVSGVATNRTHFLQFPSSLSGAFPLPSRVIGDCVELPTVGSINEEATQEGQDTDGSDVLAAVMCTSRAQLNGQVASAFIMIPMPGAFKDDAATQYDEQNSDVSQLASFVGLPRLWASSFNHNGSADFATTISSQLVQLVGRPRVALSHSHYLLALGASEGRAIALYPMAETALQESADPVLSVARPSLYHLPTSLSCLRLLPMDKQDNRLVRTRLVRYGRIQRAYLSSIAISGGLRILMSARVVQFVRRKQTRTDAILEMFHFESRFAPLASYSIKRVLECAMYRIGGKQRIGLDLSAFAHVPWVQELTNILTDVPAPADEVVWVPVSVHICDGRAPGSSWTGFVIALQPIIRTLHVEEVNDRDVSCDSKPEDDTTRPEDREPPAKPSVAYAQACIGNLRRLKEASVDSAGQGKTHNALQLCQFNQGATLVVAVSFGATLPLIQGSRPNPGEAPVMGEGTPHETGVRMQLLNSPLSPMAAIAELPSSSLIATGHVDGSVSIFALPTLRRVLTIPSPSVTDHAVVTSLAWRPRRAVLAQSAQLDGSITESDGNAESSNADNVLTHDPSLSRLYARLPKIVQRELDVNIGNISPHDLLLWIERESQMATLDAIKASPEKREELSKLAASLMCLLAVAYSDGRVRLFEIDDRSLACLAYAEDEN